MSLRIAINFVKRSIPNIIKYNWHYASKLRFLRKSASYTNEQIVDYQQYQLNKTIKAYCKLRNINVTGKEKIQSFPLSNKNDYLTDSAFLYTSPRKTYKTNTGGTTGSPLTMYKSRKDLAYEAAYVDFYLIRYGVNVYRPYKTVRIRGDKIDGWCQQRGYNKYSLSSYNINKKTSQQYHNFLKRFSPDVIFAYPSSLYLLCKELKEIGTREKIKAKVIVCSSECLFEHQYLLIRDYFDGQIINLFGNTEHTVFAVDVMDGNGFTVNPFYSYVENIDGNLVSTSFNDENMPFLRYKSDDLITIDENGKVKLDGRTQDIAKGNSGQEYPLVGLIFGQHFTFFDHITEMQVVQNCQGVIQLSYFSPKEVESHILEQTLAIINDVTKGDLDVQFDWQKSPLPRTRAGKLKFFINNID
ncbi:hypothetical protein J4H64_15820 [Vibrio alginolyticus]|uniref:hypothetical protein n=1 Tax=Vibrio alginolyticus TaxID=663 RepID=UPI001BD26BBB|nr:hypothetical protein [Vibrio alginolyticus]EIC9816911.1 hypothetical protein [Vibrio alginolyticus]EII5413393.1 hypothetical protein [Vibrio alginolyticus]EJG0480648.1 hypothetical protein [Vibrio alginolyticus]MBS9947877.1 hypothetical protein [Vibrio alginolyticus]